MKHWLAFSIATVVALVGSLPAFAANDEALRARALALLDSEQYARAESLLARAPMPLERAAMSLGETELELLRLEARGQAPGCPDSTWLRRCERITRLLDHAPAATRLRAWTARSLVESRFGLTTSATRSARTARSLVSARTRPRATVRAMIASAEAWMANAPDSALGVLAPAEQLLSRAPHGERQLLWPRVLRLRGEAEFLLGQLTTAADLLSEAHSLAMRDLPASDAEAGRALAVLGIVENQLLRNEAGNRHRREAVDLLVHRVGLADERTCRAYLTYSWTQAEPRESHVVLQELAVARNAMAAAGFSGTIGWSWLEEGLARAHVSLGHWDQVRALYLQALDCRIRWCGPWHQDVGSLRLDIASSFRRVDSPFALEQATTSKAICDSLGCFSESRVLLLHTILGTIYANLSRWQEARSELEPAVTGYLRRNGPMHWETADAAVQLARITWLLGDSTAADSLYALSTRAADFGDTEEAAFITTNMIRRARFLLARGQIDTLAALTMGRTRSMADALDGVLPWLADDEGERVAIPYRNLTDILLSSMLDARTLPPNYAADVFELALRGRTIVLESRLARSRDMARDQRDSSRTGRIRAQLRRELAEVTLSAFRHEGGNSSKSRRDGLREALRQLESPTFDEWSPSTAVLRFSEFRAHIPESTAVVSYFRIADQRAVNPAVLRPRELPQRLVAFVTSSATGTPRWFDLGPVAVVDSLATLYLRRVAGDSTALALLAGCALRDRVWSPLASELHGMQRAFIVTEGMLDLIPFHALPDSNGRYLVEEGMILHRLVHERDLLLPEPSPRGRHDALLVGDIDFDAGNGSRIASSAKLRSVPDCAAPLEAPFSRLQASRSEIESLRGILSKAPGWSVTTWTGAEASEGAIKDLDHGPEVLHLATHGFFIDSTCSKGAGDVELLVSNPLVFSGVVLAGANRASSARSAGEEDGLLTAEELAGLDLRGTRWLVLSGCRSGAGHDLRKSGEGLYGLPRAARASGARTTFISAWPVNDETTAYWMTALYQARFHRGEDTAQSVQSATRATLHRLRAIGARTSPRLWGAFFAVGDWR